MWEVWDFVPAQIQELISRSQGRIFVAGGFVRSAVREEPFRDIDVYGFRNANEAHNTAQLLGTQIVAESEWALSVKLPVFGAGTDGMVMWREVDVQFCHRHGAIEPYKLVSEEFDLSHCCGAVFGPPGANRPDTGWTNAHGFWSHCQSQTMWVGGKVDPRTPARVMKFVAQGWKMSASELAKVFERIGGLGEGVLSGLVENVRFES